MTTTKEPAELLFDWEWSDAAKAVFFRDASTGKGRMNIKAGMNAALNYDGPPLLASVLDRMVVNMANHPTLGQRVLHLSPGPDGQVHLPIDEDLIRLVLFNTLPPGVDQRWAEEQGNDGTTPTGREL